MNKVITISALGDNYTYLYQYGPADALAVDPCDSSKVLIALDQHGLNLTMIVVTHHHFDHTGGIGDLKYKTGCKVFGGDKRIPGIDCIVEEGFVIDAGDKKMNVISTPGHTETSVCYYVPADEGERGILFTGDTMFVAGCGRIFGAAPQTMWGSLKKICTLPDDTFVYPGHDYTVEDYELALTIDKDNDVIKQALHDTKEKVKNGNVTVPSTISLEKETNVFVRAQTAEEFAKLRRRKDFF